MSRFFNIIRHLVLLFNKNQVAILLVSSLLLAGFLHGYNMFKYPYFESDEGTYMSQAFSVRESGELAPYIYWYDHPPFGWITLATWVDVLGGDWNTFGNSLNTGRTLMWLLHILQAYLVFFIVNRVTKAPWLGFLAVILFTVSPLTTYFQRRILLDNLLTTWVLLSVSMLFVKDLKLRHIVASGIFYGLAFVTKITTVMFGPAFVYLLFVMRRGLHRGFTLASWLLSAGSVVSLWIMYAAIKTELIPDPEGQRVSLIGTLRFQAGRGTELQFWEEGSSFMENVYTWLMLDSTYFYLTLIGLVASLIIVIFKKEYRFFGLSALLYTIFLIRGGIVIGFYILPLIPFISISLVLFLKMLVDDFFPKLRVPKWVLSSSLAILLVVILFHYQPKVEKYLSVDETTNQIEALRWVKENVPEEAKVLIDVYGMTELQNPDFINSKVFPNADWYFKVAKDPAIRYTKYRDDWRNFDYVLISHEMLYQASISHLPVVHDAIRNSEPVMMWDENSTSFIDVQHFISTNGDWAALHKVNSNTRTQLLFAWNYYRDNYIESYGQVVDPQTGYTTSEGQSYAMLRAALMNDRESFKGLWLWTQHQLRHRVGDSLISWQWKDGKQTDSANATDADLDIALALIFASEMFDEPSYLEDARGLIADIWKQTVVDINGLYYLLPAEKTIVNRGDFYLINPSYFSPAHYRIFAEVDTDRQREWLQLADDTYQTLNRFSEWSGGITDLPPNWALLNKNTGGLSSASAYIAQGGADYFGYDAFRTLWRVALDHAWFTTAESVSYLEAIGSLFEREWSNRGVFADGYTLAGQRLNNNPNLSIAAGILAALKVSADSQVSADVYNSLFVDELVVFPEEEYAYWGNSTNYYDANWVWFGMALFNDNLPNLWATRSR